MYKRLAAALLLICLLPVTAWADFNPYSFWQTTKPTLPSFSSYMGKYASAGRTETKDYLIYEKYSGKPSNIAAVAEQYVALLQDKFRFEIIDEQWLDFGTYARITYSLTLDTRAELSTFYISNSDDEPEWETPSAYVIVQYTIPDSGYAYVHLYYSPELKYEDTGDRYAPPGKAVTQTTRTTTQTDTESSATK